MSRLAHTAAVANKLSLEDIEHRRKNKDLALTFGIPEVDEVFTPAYGGDLISILARPGHAKTGTMVAWFRRRARVLKQRELDRFVAYVTAEDSIAQLNNFILAANTRISTTNMARGEITDDQFDRIKHAATLVTGADPHTYFLGYSDHNRRDRLPLTITNVIEELLLVEQDTGMKCDAVFVDYLQLMAGNSNQPRTVAVSDTLAECKEGTLALGAPWVVGVQARREVDLRDPPIPTESDGQWTSAIEQFSQRVISLVRPRKVRKEGEYFDDVLVRGINQLLMVIWKQKLGEPNKKFWLKYDPIFNELDKLEARMAVPDDGVIPF